MKTATGTVRADYSQYYLVADDNTLDEFDLLGNGLVVAQSGFAIVLAGTHTGPVGLTVTALGEEPALQVESWDEVAEISLITATGRLHVVEWGGSLRDDLVNLAGAGAGSYRLRIHARRRDEAALEPAVTREPVEEHLIQSWPAEPAEDKSIKSTDELAAVFRGQKPEPH